MQILEKVTVNPYICGIEFDFTGQLTPLDSAEIQSFFSSKANQLTWKESYFGKKTVSFRETSKPDKKANTVYLQTLKIKFPSNDQNRSDRIYLFSKIKFIRIILNNSASLVIGRNDFFQNKRPVVKITSDEKMTIVTFTTKSIFPTGFAEITDISEISDQLLPADVPLTFINIVW
jgi:hypothetical protein